MTTRFSRFITIITITGGLFVAAAGPAGAQRDKKSPTVTGKWTLSVESGHGTTPMGLTLKQDGKSVTGTFSSPHGDSPVEGEFADSTLTLATTAAGDDSPHVTFKARLRDNGTLAGYLSSHMGDMQWTAERAKE